MKRRFLLLTGLLGLLLIGGGLAIFTHQPSTGTPTSSTSKPTPKRQTPKLTVHELAHNPELKYTSIIYFALHQPKLQRWQELSDLEAGWQVERYPHGNDWRYLVWPDKHITDAEKNLEPNWFRLTAHQGVAYDSMIVHSFRKDQTYSTTLPKIVTLINERHAAKQVRHLSHNLTVKSHK
ncbi:hypothetical protein [Levilactobacillus senmaizukei]|uniref:hypothetical protein n=1 Tax=Levilactobacillus senmaizukei TaxID=431273 RepID=UPI00077C072B|nr:hypothetical protein [Levilactobacillus senmaizukei]